MAETDLTKTVTLTPQESAVIQVATDEFRKTKISFRDYLITLRRIKPQEHYIISFHSNQIANNKANVVRFGSPEEKPTFEVVIKTTPISIDIVKSYFSR
jgi:hypothetical protein